VEGAAVAKVWGPLAKIVAVMSKHESHLPFSLIASCYMCAL
jgi:hypothetical protein